MVHVISRVCHNFVCKGRFLLLGETDVERHQTVRAKLEGYLSHAEELYKKYIEPFSKDATSKVTHNIKEL